MPDTPRCLIVIPCLNEATHLEPLVLNLLPGCDAQTARIVIADGGSSDGTPQIAAALAQRWPQVTYLHNPRRLQSAAVNLAVATYGQDAEILIRIDAHAGYPADYIGTLLREAATTGAASIVVGMATVGQTPFQRAIAAAQNSKLGNGGSAHRLAGAAGCWVEHGHHALMRLDAFRAVGGYDDTFAHNEDAELDHRLTRAGHRIWLTSRTALTYYPRATITGLFRQYVGYGRGRARTIIKHYLRPRLRQLAPAAVLPMLGLALAAPWFALAALPLLAWLALCLGYGLLLAIRAQDATLALAGPAAITMHFGWSLGFWQAVATQGNRA